MRRFAILTALALFVLAACSGSKPEKTLVQEFFEGEHEIRKMMPMASNEGIKGSFGFFLIAGGGSISGGDVRYEVKFAWKSNVDDTYIISSFPLERIRVRLRNDAVVPTAWFKIYGDGASGNIYLGQGEGPQRVIDRGYIEYVVLTVRPEDWPTNVNLPLNELRQK